MATKHHSITGFTARTAFASLLAQMPRCRLIIS